MSHVTVHNMETFQICQPFEKSKWMFCTRVSFNFSSIVPISAYLDSHTHIYTAPCSCYVRAHFRRASPLLGCSTPSGRVEHPNQLGPNWKAREGSGRVISVTGKLTSWCSWTLAQPALTTSARVWVGSGSRREAVACFPDRQNWSL